MKNTQSCTTGNQKQNKRMKDVKLDFDPMLRSPNQKLIPIRWRITTFISIKSLYVNDVG